MKILLFLVSAFVAANGQWTPHWWSGRSGMVHLFEWPWRDVANECEVFLGPNGYAGIQVSSPWWGTYQSGVTRIGTREQLADMVRRCNAVGVRIYPVVFISTMANKDGIPYGPTVFNPRCNNQDKKCLFPNLRLDSRYDTSVIVSYLNDLISIGVAGFHINSVKDLLPSDLESIISKLNNLNTHHGFPANSRPFIIQNLADLDDDHANKEDFLSIGTITEFRYSAEIGRVFRGYELLRNLRNFGEEWGFVPSLKAVTFIDSHDNQRGQGPGDDNILNYKSAKLYKMATAFHLAWPYGIPRIMSSFEFSNGDEGPPANADGTLRSPTFNADGSCSGGWICEHRWRQIFNMVRFRNTVSTAAVANWWENSGGQQIAFSRGNRGFIVFNNENFNLNQVLQTGLPAGNYCELASGSRSGNSCTGSTITVDGSGNARFVIAANAFDGFLAIHVDARL